MQTIAKYPPIVSSKSPLGEYCFLYLAIFPSIPSHIFHIKKEKHPHSRKLTLPPKATKKKPTTQKTNDTLSIEISDYAASILEKYLPGKKGDEKVFPHLTNCQLNLNIKTLGLICEFNDPQTRVFYRGRKRLERTVPKWECLSTHCARRTFICNALSSGVNAPTIMKWTGHSDYSAMKPYIDVTDRDKENSMKKIFSNVI